MIALRFQTLIFSLKFALLFVSICLICGKIRSVCTDRYGTFVTHPWIVRDVETEQRMMINNQQVLTISIVLLFCLTSH